MTTDERLDELTRELRALRLEVAALAKPPAPPALETLAAILTRSPGACRELLRRDEALRLLGVRKGRTLMFDRASVESYMRSRSAPDCGVSDEPRQCDGPRAGESART